MLKSKELSDPNSCLNKSRDNEMLFVLLGRDLSAPRTIRFWIIDRIVCGKNKYDDPQITEAIACVNHILVEQGYKPWPMEAFKPIGW